MYEMLLFADFWNGWNVADLGDTFVFSSTFSSMILYYPTQNLYLSIGFIIILGLTTAPINNAFL